MHFTLACSSWLNQVERFFAYVTADLLQRSDDRSVQALEADIRTVGQGLERGPQAVPLDQIAEQIRDLLKRLRQRTTGAGH